MKREKNIRLSGPVTDYLKRNILLPALILPAFLLTWVLHQPVGKFPSYIEWNTIYTLAGLLVITMGIKESGFFHVMAYHLSGKIRRERYLALFLVFLAAFLSSFLTNDIALFIIVPLTLGFQDVLQKDYSRIIIFEALAVNAGSALTPIGNPQNIFLWHRWDISFLSFVKEMAPLVLILMVWLFLFVIIVFRSVKIKANHRYAGGADKKLFYLSLLLLASFIFFIEIDYGAWFLPAIFILYLFYSPKVLTGADWTLLFLFVFIFIDIDLFCQIPAIARFFSQPALQDPGRLFLTGTLGSQLLSNVPATVLLSHYTTNFKVLAYAVNTGGNGLMIASFANLIALRFISNRKKYCRFHFYSLVFFLITLMSVWFLLIR